MAPQVTSEFRLLKPPSGLSSSQRFTQRNLYAALQYIDRDDPANSKLLTVPQAPHGGGREPAFDARNKAQLADLQKWIEHIVPPKETPAPPTIALQGMQLSSPLRTPGHEGVNSAVQATHARLNWCDSRHPQSGGPQSGNTIACAKVSTPLAPCAIRLIRKSSIAGKL